MKRYLFWLFSGSLGKCWESNEACTQRGSAGAFVFLLASGGPVPEPYAGLGSTSRVFPWGQADPSVAATKHFLTIQLGQTSVLATPCTLWWRTWSFPSWPWEAPFLRFEGRDPHPHTSLHGVGQGSPCTTGLSKIPHLISNHPWPIYILREGEGLKKCYKTSFRAPPLIILYYVWNIPSLASVLPSKPPAIQISFTTKIISLEFSAFILS